MNQNQNEPNLDDLIIHNYIFAKQRLMLFFKIFLVSLVFNLMGIQFQIFEETFGFTVYELIRQVLYIFIGLFIGNWFSIQELKNRQNKE